MKLAYRGKDKHGEVYFYHFGTGWQELVFRSHVAAKQFAEDEGAEYEGPANEAYTAKRWK